MHLELIMSCFVKHHLYQSTIHPETGEHKTDLKRFSPWWVFDFAIVDPDSDWDEPSTRFEFRIVTDTWQDLEFELTLQDRELCLAVIAAFPEYEKRFPSSFSRKNHPSLFDEYSNQYFSGLMDLISKLPVTF